MSGGKPRPRNESVDSAMIAAATSMVPATITGPSEFGRMWRTTWRVVVAPSARAASTNSFSRSDRNCARTRRATGIQRKPPITTTIRMKMPTSGPTSALQRIAEEIDDEQQQRQLRQREEEIRQPHQRRVDAAARDARDRADQHADDDRDQHRREPDRERDAPAVEHAREQVLAEVVGAERVLPRRTLQPRAEVDLVDRHLPEQRPDQHREHHDDQDAPRRRAPADGGGSAARPRPRASRLRARARAPAAPLAVSDAGVEPAIEDVGEQIAEDHQASRTRT